MTQTTISLPEDLLERLKDCATESGITVERLITEILENTEKANEPISRTASVKPREFKSLGCFDSGFTDTSELASDMRNFFEPRSWR